MLISFLRFLHNIRKNRKRYIRKLCGEVTPQDERGRPRPHLSLERGRPRPHRYCRALKEMWEAELELGGPGRGSALTGIRFVKLRLKITGGHTPGGKRTSSSASLLSSAKRDAGSRAGARRTRERKRAHGDSICQTSFENHRRSRPAGTWTSSSASLSGTRTSSSASLLSSAKRDVGSRAGARRTRERKRAHGDSICQTSFENHGRSRPTGARTSSSASLILRRRRRSPSGVKKSMDNRES